MRKINIVLAILVLVVICIIAPIAINILFKWNSNIFFIEAEWSAGDALNYLGTIIAATIGIIGVFITVKYAQENYKDDILKQVLPFFALNILDKKTREFSWFSDPEEIMKSIDDNCHDDQENIYKEYKTRYVYFVLKENQTTPKSCLSAAEKNTLENNGYGVEKGSNGEYIYKKKMTMSMPLELENVGKGAAINVRIGFNNVKEGNKKYLKPQNIKVGDSFYINIFSENIDDKVIGEYMLEVIYEDIYQNCYNQVYEIKIEKEGIRYVSAIKFKSNQSKVERSEEYD